MTTTQDQLRKEFQDTFEGANFSSRSIADLWHWITTVYSQQAAEEATRKVWEKFDEAINTKFPPTFIEETSYGHGVIKQGVQESSYVRRATLEEEKFLAFIGEIRDKIKKGNGK